MVDLISIGDFMPETIPLKSEQKPKWYQDGEFTIYQGKYLVSILGYFLGFICIGIVIGSIVGQGYGWTLFGILITIAIYRHRKIQFR